jgi:biotin transport system substrate-specific component
MKREVEMSSSSSSIAHVESARSRTLNTALQIALIVGASFLVALCARIYVPIPGTPVPLTVQNFAVLLVGLALGRRRGFAALALYLAEGAAGMPVFSPHGPGGIAQILGPTGGYLIAYPFVAGLVGYLSERGTLTFLRAALAAFAGEVLLFACGISWLYVWTHSLARALAFGLYWFVFAEILKVMFAAGAVRTWHALFPRE